MSRTSKVTALIVAAVLAAALGVVWPLVGFASSGKAAAILASNTFTDSSGDSGDGPDITTVQVSDDSSGKISFAATIANRTTLTTEDAVQAFFDTDKNSSTGGNGGFDYEVAWITNHQELDKWDGSQFATVTPAPKSFSASFKNGQAIFSIDKADFGGSATFNLILTTTGDTGDSTADRAPNGSAVWTYPSSSNPPPPPPPPGSPPPPPPPPGKVTLIVTGFSVGKPHSGKLFTVAEVVRVKQTGVAVKTKVTCSAKLAGKTIKPSKQGSVFSGRASCTWKLPKNTKGKKLTGSITAAYQSAKIRKTFSKTVLP